MDEISELDSLICNLAHFYKGSASFEWLEKQPMSKMVRLSKEASKINKAMQPKERRVLEGQDGSLYREL